MTQKEILRTPLHLFLLLDGLDEERRDVGFANIGELFDRYWQRKQQAVSFRLGHESAWVPVIDKLCDAMSRDLTVYVRDILLDDHAETKNAMLTEHVLVQDGTKIRFFHESFFDYSYARRFSATGGNLMALLLSGEQHLFRRSQVRQILSYMRDHMPQSYLPQLRELLSHAEVRFHIKRLVLAWLGTLPDPAAEEWAVVESALVDPDLQRTRTAANSQQSSLVRTLIAARRDQGMVGEPQPNHRRSRHVVPCVRSVAKTTFGDYCRASDTAPRSKHGMDKPLAMVL